MLYRQGVDVSLWLLHQRAGESYETSVLSLN